MAEEEKAKEPEKKIIVDEDWKQEAKREKEVLAAQEQAEKEKTAEKAKAHGPLPKGNFAALVSMLVSQAYFSLGLLGTKDQEEQQREPDLQLAKYNIDMLEALDEKTKGNLSEQEQNVLKDVLNQVRMAYVKVSEAQKKQPEK